MRALRMAGVTCGRGLQTEPLVLSGRAMPTRPLWARGLPGMTSRARRDVQTPNDLTNSRVQADG